MDVLNLYYIIFCLIYALEQGGEQTFIWRKKRGGDGVFQAEGAADNHTQADQGGIGDGKGRLRGALLSDYNL